LGRRHNSDGVVLEEVAAGQEDDWRRRLTVRPAADAIVVLQRQIAVAQLDARMWPLSGATMVHKDSSRWRGNLSLALGA
jgi:hypothetical protein